ncbi:MAG: hypothetical protein ACRCYY_00025, partial [Trueperaceae bacterium]
SIGGLAIMMVEPYVPLGYATVGILRLFLVPVLMSFGENNLGAVAGVFVISAGFHVANASLKPAVAWLVEKGQWKLALGVAIFLVVVSALTAYLSRGGKEQVREQRVPNPTLLGRGIICYVGFQFFFGIREITVFPLAEKVLGSTYEAGLLEGIAEGAMVVGTLLTTFLRPSLLVPMLCAQGFSGLIVLGALYTHNPHVLYAARIVEGLSHAILERVSEMVVLGYLGGLITQ